MRPLSLAGLLMILATGCGRPERGTDVAAEPGGPAWTLALDLFEHTEAAAANAAAVWGAAPSVLDGWAFDYGPIDGTAIGLTYNDEHLVVLDPGAGTCLEGTALWHEVGHVIIDDHDHQDPRWRDPAFWQRMETALTLTALGDGPCQASIHHAVTMFHPK